MSDFQMSVAIDTAAAKAGETAYIQSLDNIISAVARVHGAVARMGAKFAQVSQHSVDDMQKLGAAIQSVQQHALGLSGALSHVAQHSRTSGAGVAQAFRNLNLGGVVGQLQQLNQAFSHLQQSSTVMAQLSQHLATVAQNAQRAAGGIRNVNSAAAGGSSSQQMGLLHRSIGNVSNALGHATFGFLGMSKAAADGAHSALLKLNQLKHTDPPRICRRLQLLRDWSHDESTDISEVFP